VLYDTEVLWLVSTYKAVLNAYKGRGRGSNYCKNSAH
jgi:hypothetical protein